MTVAPRSGRRTGVVAVVLLVCLVLVVVLVVSVSQWMGDSDSAGGSPTVTTPANSQASQSSSGAPSSSQPSLEPSPSSGSVAPPQKATEVPARPGWIGLRTPDGWTYQVPKGGGWSNSQDVMAYVDRRGKVLVQATQPSYYRAGECRSSHSVARAVVGWATPDAGKSAAEVAKSWATAVSVHDDGSQDQVSRVVTRPIKNSAMEIEHSAVLVTANDAQGCLPRRTQVSATSYRGEGGTRTLVIVRDLGVDGGLSTKVKEQIVRGVRHTAD